MIARDEAALASLDEPDWKPLPVVPGARAWTDDYSNVLQAPAHCTLAFCRQTDDRLL